MNFVIDGYGYILTRLSISEGRVWSNQRVFSFAQIERWELPGISTHSYYGGLARASRGSLHAERAMPRSR